MAHTEVQPALFMDWLLQVAAPAHLTPAKEALYFSADDGAHGEEVWVLRR